MPYISEDSNERKKLPMARGLLDYFPAALAAVAAHSLMADEKHNGPSDGQRDPTWKRGVSTDHADCIVRHLVGRGGFDGPYRESTALAWRALALLQEELEAEGAEPGRASRFPETSGHVHAQPLNLCPEDDFVSGAQWARERWAMMYGTPLEINRLPGPAGRTNPAFKKTDEAGYEVTQAGLEELAEYLRPKKRVLPKKKAAPKARRKRK